MTEIQSALFAVRDEAFAAFQAKLIPNIDSKRIIGVKMPILRGYAKSIAGSDLPRGLMQTLPHRYYEEDVLHSIFLSAEKDYEKCIEGLERFLPHVDNWAVCDVTKPVCFAKNKQLLIEKIKQWISSDRAYTIRFGMNMLMTHYLDGDFNSEYPALVAAVKSDDYYVKMMQAWYFATALAKRYDEVLPYLQNGVLPVWVHNKTIQKANESYRIGEEKKELLKKLRERR